MLAKQKKKGKLHNYNSWTGTKWPTGLGALYSQLYKKNCWLIERTVFNSSSAAHLFLGYNSLIHSYTSYISN